MEHDEYFICFIMISRKSYHLSLIVNQYAREDKLVIENSMIDA